MYLAKSVDEYVNDHPKWSDELNVLREIMLETELDEKVKWGIPTYCLKNKNVVGFAGFNEYFGLWYFQGVFLKDDQKVLINAQDGKTKGLRQMRFTDKSQIDRELILAYTEEAIQNQKDGKEITVTRKMKVVLPAELQHAFNSETGLREAFNKLTPGKQREYAEYIGEAKREATRLSRLEKSIPMIIDGVGLHDKYR